MTFDEYQDLAMRTADSEEPDYEKEIAVLALGLAGECGEVVEMIKKYIGHGRPFQLSSLKQELGDVLWYLSVLAKVHGLHLEDIAAANIDKLTARYPDGFVAGGGKR